MRAAALIAVPDAGRQNSWVPLVVVALAQILMAFNINALRVSIGGIVATLGTSPTTVGTAIVTHSLFIAGLVMLGGKIGALCGPRPVFKVTVLLFGAAMVIMALSSSAMMMIVAQGIAGAAGAALVPTLVVLIAANYRGRQQTQALGWLGASEAMGGVLAFLVAGFLGTWIGWRYPFGLLGVLAACTFLLSRRLNPVETQGDFRIDAVGVVLGALAVILICVGFDSTNSWGLLLAEPEAPFSLFGLSPAPVMIVVGVAFGQAFFAWSKRRQAAQKRPLIALEVIETPQQGSAVFSMFMIVLVGSAVGFLIPLYIEIVQGYSSLRTALAIIPNSLSIFVAAVLVSRLFDRLSSRHIARGGFVVVAAGLALLAVVIHNEWDTLMVIVALVVIGLGQGALVTVLFNVLAAATPEVLAGDVASLRGTTTNLAGAVGTAVAGALSVGVLSASIATMLINNPVIPRELKVQVDLDKVGFVSNDRLVEVMEGTAATPEQITEAARINAQARLRSLRICLLALTGVALLAIFPTGALPPETSELVTRASSRSGNAA
ncbi:MAG: MFS transporter [Alphaproteobacteria bacterium]|nr:MFS transporter [Alphaproteobacteria bacterium]